MRAKQKPTKNDCYRKIVEARREMGRLRIALEEGDPDKINYAVQEVELTSWEATKTALAYIGYGY